jgi:hypothetical protein
MLLLDWPWLFKGVGGEFEGVRNCIFSAKLFHTKLPSARIWNFEREEPLGRKAKNIRGEGHRVYSVHHQRCQNVNPGIYVFALLEQARCIDLVKSEKTVR